MVKIHWVEINKINYAYHLVVDMVVSWINLAGVTISF